MPTYTYKPTHYRPWPGSFPTPGPGTGPGSKLQVDVDESEVTALSNEFSGSPFYKGLDSSHASASTQTVTSYYSPRSPIPMGQRIPSPPMGQQIPMMDRVTSPRRAGRPDLYPPVIDMDRRLSPGSLGQAWRKFNESLIKLTEQLTQPFHVYAPEFKDAVTADEKLQVAALELQVKNSELLHVRKLLLRLELSPIFGSVGLAGYLLSALYRAVLAIVLWMANSNGAGDSPLTDGDVKE